MVTSASSIAAACCAGVNYYDCLAIKSIWRSYLVRLGLLFWAFYAIGHVSCQVVNPARNPHQTLGKLVTNVKLLTPFVYT